MEEWSNCITDWLQQGQPLLLEKAPPRIRFFREEAGGKGQSRLTAILPAINSNSKVVRAEQGKVEIRLWQWVSRAWGGFCTPKKKKKRLNFNL